MSERPKWDPTNPKCEAKVSTKILQEGHFGGLSNLDGKIVPLAPGEKEAPEIRETTIACAACPVHEVFRSEGLGFAAYNDASRKVDGFLQNHCAKLLARGYKPGQIPKNLLPR